LSRRIFFILFLGLWQTAAHLWIISTSNLQMLHVVWIGIILSENF